MSISTISKEIHKEKDSVHVQRKQQVDSMTFVLFGATGDLAKRKIYPALFNLYLNKKLPDSFSGYWCRKKRTCPMLSFKHA